MAEHTLEQWRVGDEMLTPAGMLQLFHGNTDVGCLEKIFADDIVKRLNSHDALLEALELYLDCDGYEDEIKAKARAAIVLVRGEEGKGID